MIKTNMCWLYCRHLCVINIMVHDNTVFDINDSLSPLQLGDGQLMGELIMMICTGVDLSPMILLQKQNKNVSSVLRSDTLTRVRCKESLPGVLLCTLVEMCISSLKTTALRRVREKCSLFFHKMHSFCHYHMFYFI